MLFGHYDRYQYAKSPLVEVICQLRFPTILSIGSQEPAAFQEAIRREFPATPSGRNSPLPGWWAQAVRPPSWRPSPL